MTRRSRAGLISELQRGKPRLLAMMLSDELIRGNRVRVIRTGNGFQIGAREPSVRAAVTALRMRMPQTR